MVRGVQGGKDGKATSGETYLKHCHCIIINDGTAQDHGGWTNNMKMCGGGDEDEGGGGEVGAFRIGKVLAKTDIPGRNIFIPGAALLMPC